MTELTLEALGWNEWFASQTGRCRGDDGNARVAAVDRDQLFLVGKPGFFRAKLSGQYLQESGGPVPRPCVGDWVCVARGPGDQVGVVHAILDRRTSLRRRAPGDSVQYQMIAANVDFVIVVQSCHYDFNLQRLERYLVMVQDGGAVPLVLLTKTDLITPDVLSAQVDQIRSAGITGSVMALSNVTKDGVAELTSVLAPAKTYCFVGSSGVGKSTIINGLMGRDVLETAVVSGSGEGRHTTVRRELFLLDNGAMVIDNPGMREFGVSAPGGGVEAGFADIAALASQCRFGDCTHTQEPGCAVLEAVQSGGIGADHYRNFVKLGKEAHTHLSRGEIRKNNREVGRLLRKDVKHE